MNEQYYWFEMELSIFLRDFHAPWNAILHTFTYHCILVYYLQNSITLQTIQ